MALRFLSAYLGLLCGFLAISNTAVLGQFSAQRQDDRIDVLRDGKLVTSYRYRSGSKPVLWPIHGPDDKRMTRSYPLDATVPNEAHDHPHHRGLWMTFGEVDGADWWAEGKGKGLVAHSKVVSLTPSGDSITPGASDASGGRQA